MLIHVPLWGNGVVRDGRVPGERLPQAFHVSTQLVRGSLMLAPFATGELPPGPRELGLS
jgi:hypothetical protein